jgi:hypothetical protein
MMLGIGHAIPSFVHLTARFPVYASRSCFSCSAFLSSQNVEINDKIKRKHIYDREWLTPGLSGTRSDYARFAEKKAGKITGIYDIITIWWKIFMGLSMPEGC